ncbi:histidine kinase [Streptomyces capparidis]
MHAHRWERPLRAAGRVLVGRPGDGPWSDAPLTAHVLAVQTVIGLLAQDGRRPDAAGWVLLTACALPLLARRRRPLAVLVAVLAAVVPYHVLDNEHSAPLPATVIAIYTAARYGSRRRSWALAAGLVALVAGVMTVAAPDHRVEIGRSSGWILAVVAFGEAVRSHRTYLAAVVDRAERAERTREEEAARRVAEERLRIARDLHDLLAHSITLIGVQASVAAHLLVADPERLDRGNLAECLETISDTCRDARSELRATLAVLRQGEPEPKGALPAPAAIAGLADAVRATGVRVEVTVPREPVPPAVGAAAYRIVQEALTNVVKHAGASRAAVEVVREPGALRVAVTDDGRGGAAAGGGYGILGMTERARSVGGTLRAGPGPHGGFAVAATLPLPDPGEEPRAP